MGTVSPALALTARQGVKTWPSLRGVGGWSMELSGYFAGFTLCLDLLSFNIPSPNELSTRY